jgi:AcrR family transcriptional regulator
LTPLNEEQLHQIRDERTEQILNAAVKVFARRGFSKSKMGMIAAEANISHGLLYHYFSSKDELFNTLVQVALEEAVKTVAGVYALPGSPTEKMRALTEIVLAEENTPYFLLIYQARMADDVPPPARTLVEQYPVQVFIDHLRPLFVEGQQLGEFVDKKPEILITWYFTVISGLMVANNPALKEYQVPHVDLLLRMITAH